MKKFLICSPGYNPNNGGVIALHKLCDLINSTGAEAFMHPFENNYEFNRFNFCKVTLNFLKNQIRSTYRPYRINNFFNTPVIKNFNSIKDPNNWIVIYPEITFGNPLNAKNVVRWLLHNPGFHTGKIYYHPNEIYFKFNSAIKEFNYPGSTTSSNELKVIHYPTEYYNKNDLSQNRIGTAYCIRKGRNKKIAHDLNNSILIDGMSHESISKILKKVKTFISYDTYTAYSIFAVLCGCQSIVIPDPGITEDQWYPNPSDRYGLSYGFENIDYAQKTKHLVYEHISKEQEKSYANVQNFISECYSFFK